jgi:tetratricopeptide (TPR) repeat protein
MTRSQQNNRVKWFLGASICLFLSIVTVRGDAATDLLNQGQNAMASGDYATAAKLFDQIVTTYPSTPNIEDIEVRAGYAYLHGGDFLKAISELSKLTSEETKPEFRGSALFFTGLAQFSQAHKLTDATQSADFYRQAEETMGTLIDFIGQSTLPASKDFLEDAMYYQALAAFGQDKYDDAETDMNNLLAKFGASLQKPDYLLLLGSIYAVQASADITGATDKQPVDKDKTRADAQKAIDTLNQVSTDPNALVQANDADMRKAEILYLIAQLDPGTEGYAKALDAFREVHRKDDMILIQQTRVDQLRAKVGNDVRGANAGIAMANSRLIDRELARLNDLKAGPDPIIQALLRMAECYIAMKKPDEARTILHRLGVVKLTDVQQQEADFQTLYSYTLGGQAEKADAALTAYLAKHPGDPQADSISVQIAAALMKRSDYAGALAQAQRSLKDFPTGKHVGEAVQLESEALNKLGRLDEADKAEDDFIAKNANSPVAIQLLVNKGEGQVARGNLNGALISFGKVKDNPAAGPYQSAAAAYYINTLNSLKRYNDVIAEATAFAKKYPTDKALASVSVISAMAMDKLNDPVAITALQDVAKKFSDNVDVGSFALYYLSTIYQRQNKIPEMTQTVAQLRTSFPTAYALISQATDNVTVVLIKEKKFDEAAAAYQPLVGVKAKEVAAGAQNKIGGVWLAGAKAMGSYQSLQTDAARAEAEKRLQSAEQAYLATLKNFPDDVSAVGDAFKGLVDAGLQRRTWGLLKDADLEGYLGKLGADLTTPVMQARLEMAKAGLVFVIKNGQDQYPAALDRFTKAVATITAINEASEKEKPPQPDIALTVQEADQYGQLLIFAKKYTEALKVYSDLQASAKPTDQVKLAEAYYGLAATYLASGDLPSAKVYFVKMQSLPNGAARSPHALESELGMAQINEQSKDPADLAAAKDAYGTIMRSPLSGARMQAEAMLGYGGILEKTGHPVKTASQTDIEFATHYYEQVNLFYGNAPGTSELSAEGLYLAGQAYTKAGDAADAKKSFDLLRATYSKTAPDWVAKAPAP